MGIRNTYSAFVLKSILIKKPMDMFKSISFNLVFSCFHYETIKKPIILKYTFTVWLYPPFKHYILEIYNVYLQIKLL